MEEKDKVVEFRGKRKSKLANAETFSLNQLFPEHICPFCKKRFAFKIGQNMSSYAYKMVHNGKLHVMCSYSCFRVLQKEVEAKKKCS